MSIYIQRESGGGVAKIPLNGLYIIPILKRKDGEGVAKIVHPAIRCSNLSGQLLIVQIHCLGA